MALRSLPRRFRALAAPHPEDDGPPVATALSGERAERRQGAALAEAAEAAEAIAAVGTDLRRVLVEDNPSVTTEEGVATMPRHGGEPSTAVQRLTTATGEVAALAEAQPGNAWTRTGARSGGPVSAANLLREAVHAGIHHLRAAEDAA